MTSYLEPDRDRALALRHDMDAALSHSAASVVFAPDASTGSAAGPAAAFDGGTVSQDYGAYFDLVLQPESAFAQHAEAREYLRQRMAGGGSAPRGSGANDPAITTLSSLYYTPSQVERFTRWWDIEPDNAMALTAVAPEALALARERIERAFAFLALACPELREEIRVLIREIVIARPDGSHRVDFGGASSFTLFGAIALNADAHDGWPRYYQSIVHESAHTLLFAIAREEPLVLNDPDETFGSPLRDDLRPMDGLFHAAFVSVREAMALDALLCRHERVPCLTDAEAEEVSALLDGSVLAFWECAETLERDGRLSVLGRDILDECRSVMERNFALEPTVPIA